MRRGYAALALCLSIGLVGIGHRTAPRTAPTAKPSATPAPAPSAAPMPIVIVYPFGASSGLKAGTGLQTAQLFVKAIGIAGGVNAITGDAKVARADYLTDARAKHADYYVAGYMTLVGDGVSLVEQIVSTTSGTVVLGRTAQVQTVEDAVANAGAIHDVIVQREQSFAAAISSSNAAPSSNPTPLAKDQANLTGVGEGIAGLFKRKDKGTAVAQATPVPEAQKPGKGVYVAHVNGSVAAGDLSSATTALFTALNAKYKTQMTGATGNISTQADKICGTSRNNVVATGDLATNTQHRTFGSRTTYAFKLHVYTCFGAELATADGQGNTVWDAVRGAVAAYAAGHPQND